MVNSASVHQIEPLPAPEPTIDRATGLGSSTSATSRAGAPSAVVQATLEAGAMFGNYRICEPIGAGSMGVVYRAEHTLLEKQVALKVMAGGLQSSVEARQRFLNEAQTAAAIAHANVVDVTDVGVHEGTPYLVMQLLAGEDLDSYLGKQGCLPEHQAVRLFVPIAAAVAAAHDRHIVHRDLKPSNIFLARDPAGVVTPKILDFGISRAPRALAGDGLRATSVNELMGSPLYWPPEAVSGSRDLSEKSDQYSLGVVLYECVTGKNPIQGDSLLSLLAAIARGDWPRPSQIQGDLSPALERIILRAMAVDPAARFADMREFGRALLEVADARTQLFWAREFGRGESQPEGRQDLQRPALRTAPAGVALAPARRRSWSLPLLSFIGVASLASWMAYFAFAPPVRARSNPRRVLEDVSAQLAALAFAQRGAAGNLAQPEAVLALAPRQSNAPVVDGAQSGRRGGQKVAAGPEFTRASSDERSLIGRLEKPLESSLKRSPRARARRPPPRVPRVDASDPPLPLPASPAVHGANEATIFE